MSRVLKGKKTGVEGGKSPQGEKQFHEVRFETDSAELSLLIKLEE
jgi:hypothetical protein